MKTILTLMLCAALMCGSCGTVILPGPSAKAPPGQVKKATGSQSAKPYAPGQQKGKN